jgi:hypothetical protein
MTDETEARRAAKDALLARFIGNSLEHDQEDIEFWRAASEEQRGRTLYRLLQFAQNVIDSTPPRPEEPLTFPGFPKGRGNAPSPGR